MINLAKVKKKKDNFQNKRRAPFYYHDYDCICSFYSPRRASLVIDKLHFQNIDYTDFFFFFFNGQQ